MFAPSHFLRSVVAALLGVGLGAAALSAPAPVYRGPPPNKEVARIEWPNTLKLPIFDDARYPFSKSFAMATREARAFGKPDRTTAEELRIAYKKLSDKLNEEADDLSPTDYIEARRFLNQMKKAVRELSDGTSQNHPRRSSAPTGIRTP